MEKEMVENQGFEEFLNKIETSRNAKADKLKTQFGFDEVNWVLTNSFYFVRNCGKWGLMTESGEWRVPCEMDAFHICPEQIGWVVPFSKESKWGFYTDGLYVEPQFDEITDEGDDVISVKLDGKWGWLDSEGRFMTKEEAEQRDELPMRWWCQECPSDGL